MFRKILILSTVFLLVACGNEVKKEGSAPVAPPTPSMPLIEEEKPKATNPKFRGEPVLLKGDELLQKFEKKESFYFIFASVLCPFCRKLQRNMQREKSNVPVYLISPEEIGKADEELRDKYFTELKKVPTVVIVKNGEIVNTLLGVIEVSAIEQFIDENFEK